MRNILIISSDYTGHGHKSITEAICEKFPRDYDIKVSVVDGFSLGGNALIKVSKSYGPIIRKAEGLWELIWDISSIKPSLINEIIELKIKDNFLKLIRNLKPDLILTVHPNFNGSIINILEKYNIRIPVMTLIADLISISPLWADSRAEYILSPTEEGKMKCIEFGVPEEKVKVLGFPVRSKFVMPKGISENYTYDSISTPLKCLIMSGGEGVGNMSKIAKILLDNFNCTVRIVAGRNYVLQKKLEQSLTDKYGSRVEIYGFMENIQDLMMSSDIAITRGSPNVMMEAISCNLPLIITGSLPGQEEENPQFAKKHKLGIICTNIKDIKNTIKSLISNNAQELNEIKKSQRDYYNPSAAEDIVKFILEADCCKEEFKVSVN